MWKALHAIIWLVAIASPLAEVGAKHYRRQVRPRIPPPDRYLSYEDIIQYLNKAALANSDRQNPLLSSAPELSLERYYTYGEMVSYLESLSKAFSGNMILNSLTKTEENRSVYEVKVFSNKTNCPKNVILLDAAINGNEWITTTVALKAIHELLLGADNTDEYNFLERSDWYILPMVNPDGYEYSLSQENNIWKKNRTPNGGDFGINLNRNFDSNWNSSTGGDIVHGWGTDFRGNKPFSEPESRAIRDVMLKLVAEQREILYISLHAEFQSSIFYPFVFSGEQTKNSGKVEWLAQYACKKVNDETKASYVHSLPPQSYKGVGGTSLNYAYQQGISLAFDLEFYQPTDKAQNTSSFVANRTAEGWSGVFYLAEGFLQNVQNCTIGYNCGCIEDDDDSYIDPSNTNSKDGLPTDDSYEYSDDCGRCDGDKNNNNNKHTNKDMNDDKNKNKNKNKNGNGDKNRDKNKDKNSDKNINYNKDKQVSSAGELCPLTGVFGTLLIYLSYSLLN